MEKYSNKPLPMAPPIPIRSSSCKTLEKVSCEPGWPRRSSSLPRLPSTSEELETLPATTYIPPNSNHRRLSKDTESLRLGERRSVLRDLPQSTYRDVVLRSPTPSPPSSPPLRHKGGLANLNSIAISDDSIRRECYILPQGQLEISFTPPSPVPSLRRLPVKAPKPPRRTSRGNKRRHRTLVVLEIIREDRRVPKMVRKVKRNSLALAYVRNVSKQSKRRSRALQPKTRCPQIVENDVEDIFLDGVEDDTESEIAATAISDADAPPSPELPFTVVYRQILEERWAKYRLLDASRAEDEKRSVADFLAKTYSREPTPDPKPLLIPYATSAQLRALSISVPQVSIAERRLTVSSPKLFRSPKEVAWKAGEKKHFWSGAAKKFEIMTWKKRREGKD